MIIGIDASRAFSNQRTGIEEYSFQVLMHLTNELRDSNVVLYVRSSTNYLPAGRQANLGTNIRITNSAHEEDVILPKSWKVKKIKWPFFWTQLGLSLEMLFHPVDVLFVPSHVVPFIHPKNTIVTIHGLEYEFFPEGYSFLERLYMRLSIKASCRWAKKIIAVSENTKKDLIKLYKLPEEKIEVIYEGCDSSVSFRANPEKAKRIEGEVEESNFVAESLKLDPSASSVADFARDDKVLLFVGRLEERKNIIGIIKAFEILKEKHKIPHRLILVGKFGYGKEKIEKYLADMPYKSDVVLPGFVSEGQKQELLENAAVFLFPSFYEGFGLPILEAQNAGVPVVTSNISSMPEIAGDGALFVDPNDPKQLAEAIYQLISDKAMRDGIIKKGRENVQKFGWSECSDSIATLLHG